MLRPGDAIQLTVWRQEDMTGEFKVDETGVVTLPLIGPKQVTGVPLAQLRETLYSELRLQLRNPSIEITPLRRIFVLGEVRTPGPYSVDPTITLAEAIALAGGPNSTGDSRRIRVVRSGKIVHDRISAETTLSSVDIRSGDQIFVEPRGWVARNTSLFANMLVSAAFITVLEVFRR